MSRKRLPAVLKQPPQVVQFDITLPASACMHLQACGVFIPSEQFQLGLPGPYLVPVGDVMEPSRRGQGSNCVGNIVGTALAHAVNSVMIFSP